MPDDLSRLIQEIVDKRSELRTWEAVGKFYAVPKIVLWRIVNDNYEPQKNEIRIKLGLAEILFVKTHRDRQGRFQKRI